MSKILQLKRSHCAGVDIGSSEVYVGFPDQSVHCFATHTSGFEQLILACKAADITSIALESTGVYGVILFDMLRVAGFEVFLVNPKYTKSRAGQKTDVKDSQWIQQLHSVDLLEPSFIPEKEIIELRSYVRLREGHIGDKARQVNKMQKALIQMNVRLDTVLSQVHGASGMKMIKAILNGERDVETLLSLCDGRIIKNKAQDVREALKGYYQPQHLFALEQAVEQYEFIQTQVTKCDQKIEDLYQRMTQDIAPPKVLPPKKAIRHNKPNIKQLQSYNLMVLDGKDLTCIPGFTDYTVMQLLAEVGSDLSAFPSEKHFTSWAGLAPSHKHSGKSHKRSGYRIKTPVGQIFRKLAQSLLTSKNHALGAFGRRIRSKKGPSVAIKALARKLAVLFYRAMTKGIGYVEQGVKDYEKQYKEQRIRILEKQALKAGYQLIKA
jgi:transposase